MCIEILSPSTATELNHPTNCSSDWTAAVAGSYSASAGLSEVCLAGHTVRIGAVQSRAGSAPTSLLHTLHSCCVDS